MVSCTTEAGLDLRQMFQDLMDYESSLGFVPYAKIPDELNASFDKLASLPAFKLLQIQHSCFEDFVLQNIYQKQTTALNHNTTKNN